jgi:hypothetical protein
MHTNDLPFKYYHVRVGHWEIRVQAHSVDEAIELARRHLSAELPRLYDVIRAMTATRFQVEAAA